MFTYFIKADKAVKIGIAGNPVKRLKYLQLMCPIKLELLGVIDGDCEAELDKKFANERLHGEWFSISPSLMQFIKERTKAMPEQKPWIPSVGMRLLTPKSIGKLITWHRKAAGLTQQDLAEKTGMSRAWIIKAEKGKDRTEIGLILRVLNALNIQLNVSEQ